MTGWQATFVLRHILSGRVCATSKTPLRDVGVHQFLRVVFVSVPVGRENCFVGFVFNVVFFSVVVLIWFDSFSSCSAHLTQRRFDVRVGMLFHRLPPSFLKNYGPRVVKQCN